MMSRHFALNSELTGAIAKRLPHAKNQPSAPGSFSINSLQIYIYIYIYIYMLQCKCETGGFANTLNSWWIRENAKPFYLKSYGRLII